MSGPNRMGYKSKSETNAWARNWRRLHPDKKRMLERNYRRSETGKAWRRGQTEKLTDEYVRQKLSAETGINLSAWPDWLVELKRKAIQLKRKYGIHQNRRRRTEQTN